MNYVTTLWKENLNKHINKAMKTITTTAEHKIVQGKTDIEVVKIESDAEVLVKKEQVTKGMQN